MTWNWVESNGDWDHNFVSLFARIAADQPGVVDWNKYNPALFTQFLRLFGMFQVDVCNG